MGAQVILPVEVIGEQGKVVQREITLTSTQAASASQFWMQVNNLSYENKASIKVNNGDWYDINHETVDMLYQEKARGGMVHGGFNTIRFTIPISGMIEGQNVISFRFNLSDGISIGYRVVSFNLLNSLGQKLLEAIQFEEEDPFEWEAPYSDAQSITEGEDLWNNASLWSNYLDEDTTGRWYAYDLSGSVPIKAACADCHVSNGYDLEYFSYSNESIIERAKFHKLSEEEGKKIASYIRTLRSEVDGLKRYGRPWNPPYQPGTELEGKSLDEWAAGAGLDAVLESDNDMLDYMFPNGMDDASIAEYFDSKKVEDHTLMPLAVQLPDWKHWLPIVHPMDGFSKDDFYNTTSVEIHPKKGLERMEEFLSAMPLEERSANDLKNELRAFHKHFRHFMDQTEGEVRHWRTGGDALRDNKYNERVASIPDEIPVELVVTSLARLLAVKNFEIMNLHDLQDKAKWFASEEDHDELTPRGWQWVGEDYNVFEVPPHFTSCVTTVNCDNFVGQSIETGHYESTAWYQLQLVLNGGNGNVGGNHPMDWQYQLDFIKRASFSSEIPEPVRYYHSLNAMYRLRTYQRNKGPNSGRAFRARQQLPHWFYGMDDSNSFSGFRPGVFPALLDDIQPGLQRKVLNALLRQFLTEVQKPEMALSGWNRRSPHGGANELEPASKSGNLVDVESRTGLYYYTDKMYYLIPKFAAIGVECDIINELVDWSSEAWPNYNWDQLRKATQTSIVLSYDSDEMCGELPRVFTAVTGNEGQNPLLEWKVNGVVQSENSTEFHFDDIQPGDEVLARVVGDHACINIKEATYSYVAPFNDFNVLVSKNNGAWTDDPIMEVCDNDQITLVLDVPLKPKLWLDAMQVNADGLDSGQTVVNWIDRSGNGYDVSADRSELYPIYNPNGLNGLPAVMFGMNNNADGLRLLSTDEDDFMEDDWTMVLTGEEYGINNWADVVGNKTESKNDDGWFFRFSEGGQTEISAGGDYYRGSTHNLPFQFLAVMVKEGRTVTLYINGRFERSLNMQDDEKITTNNAIFIGLSDKGNSGSSRYHKGPISEVMLYDYAVSESERSIIEGYLGHKWFMNESLPRSHAYLANSPFEINLGLPDNTQIALNSQNTSFSYDIDKTTMGQVEFSNPSDLCQTPIHTFATSFSFDRDNQTIGIMYALDGAPSQSGHSLVVRAEQSLEMMPEGFFGDYEWEDPIGKLLPTNTNPKINSTQNDTSIGEWILHTDLGVCLSSDTILSKFNLTFSEASPHVVLVEVTDGGSSNLTGSYQINNGNNLDFVFKPDQGYKVDKMLINDVEQTLSPNNGEVVFYQVTDIQEALDIEIQFAERNSYMVNLALSSGGSASQALGNNVVLSADSWNVMLQPDAGHRIVDIILDDKSHGAATLLAIDEVYANHQVQVKFEKFQYQISARSGSNGSISSAGTTVLEYGASQTYTISPNSGYEVDRVYVDGAFIGTSLTYVFSNLDANHTIYVEFEKEPVFYTFTIKAGDNGNITPGELTTSPGEDVTFSILPDEGYLISDVLVDRTSVGVVEEYTFTDISRAHRIEAIFEEIPMVLAGAVDANYSIYPNPVINDFTIDMDEDIKSLGLFTLEGRSIGHRSSPDMKRVHLDNPKAASGIILLKIQLENGGTITEKLIMGR